jgi:serine/threonine protein kinase
LIDFGTVREVTATYLAKVSGQQHITGIFSAGYTPPEQFNGRAVPQSDFYALGRTFVHLLTGKHPSDLPTDTRTGKLIWRDRALQISESLADLLDNLMAIFPGGRPQNAKMILQRLDQIEGNLSLTLAPTVLSPGVVPTVLSRFAAMNLQVWRLISQVLASGDSVEENRWRRLALLGGLGGAMAVAIKLYDSFNR